MKILHYFHLMLHSLISLLEIFLFFYLIFDIKNVEFIYLNIKSKNRNLARNFKYIYKLVTFSIS